MGRITREMVFDAVNTGKAVECSAEEAPELRAHLQDVAAWMIANDQGVKIHIALDMVKQLDAKHPPA